MAGEPGYCLHKPTGQAYINLGGKVHYLGTHARQSLSNATPIEGRMAYQSPLSEVWADCSGFLLGFSRLRCGVLQQLGRSVPIPACYPSPQRSSRNSACGIFGNTGIPNRCRNINALSSRSVADAAGSAWRDALDIRSPANWPRCTTQGDELGSLCERRSCLGLACADPSGRDAFVASGRADC
jgi:hypothetical protein